MLYKAIISDIDGTLAPLSMHTVISSRVKTAIKSLEQKKVIFCLATGKPFSLIKHVIDDLCLCSPIITDNGAAIFDSQSKKSIHQILLNIRKANKIIVYGQKYHKRIRYSNGYEGHDIKEVLPNNTQVTKILLMGLTKKEANEFIINMNTNFTNIAVVKTSAHEGKDFVDIYITNALATKNHAVLRVAEILGISTKEIIGIGDHYNDIPLLKACGLKVAMGNAVNDLKKIADYIAPTVNEDGIVNVIQKFCMK
jgi:HAD superfamily hydrolase (TIGR01484 family)